MDRIEHKAGTEFMAMIQTRRNLTGFSATSRIVNDRGAHDISASIVDVHGGKISLFAPASLTRNWQAGAYAWDVRLSRADGSGGDFTIPANSNLLFIVTKGATP